MELHSLTLVTAGITVAFFIIYKRFKSSDINSTKLPNYRISLINVLQCIKQVQMKNMHPLAFLFQVLNGIHKLFEREGIFFLHGFDSYIFAYKSEIVYSLLKNPVRNERPLQLKILLESLREGLLTREGEKWRRRRVLLNPAFHSRILQNYISAFNEQSEVLVEKMKKLVDYPWVDMMPLLTMTSLNIICQTAMGIRMNTREDDCDIKAFIRASEEIKTISMLRILRPWTRYGPLFNFLPVGRKYRKACDVVRNFSKKVIKEKMEYFLEQKENNFDVFEKKEENSILRKEPKVFLDLLLGYHMTDPSFSLKDLQDEVLTFISAGHETVSCALNWTVYMLGLLPDVQENAFQELTCILGDDLQRLICYEDIKGMKYLDKVIKETMRLYPPVPFISVKLKEDLEIDNYTIPKGINVVISMLGLHKDPKVFPSPEKFDVERFSSENCKTRHPYCYLPFSSGPRNCIGSTFALMEMKVLLSILLRNFRFISLDERDQIQEIYAMTLLTAKPLRIKFVHRSVT